MTDFELNNLELFAKGIKADAKTTNDIITGRAILGLVADFQRVQAESRQARAERDWLAERMPNTQCPDGKSKCNDRLPTAGGRVCYSCLMCWLEAARQATTER